MLDAVNCLPGTPPPCSFMLFGALKEQCRDSAEFVERQLELGLDAFVEIPPRPPRVKNDYYNLHGLPVHFDPQVEVVEQKLNMPGEVHPILLKEYHTPDGVLRTEIRKTPDWRWGDHVPFLDDFIIPRARKHLLTGAQDLPALKHLLVSPTPVEIQQARTECTSALEIAKSRQLMTCGGWGVGADLVGWIAGLEAMIFFTHDQPEFMEELLKVISDWNRARMAVLLDMGIDLYIKRAWYENCDFWTPRTWRRFIFPILQAEVAQAHAAGTRFGYIITSNCMPLLESIAESGVDVIIGVDPRQWDMARARQVLSGRVCLWGGVNGHLTVEQGDPDAVRAEVQSAMRLFAKQGGFILSPVDNVRQNTPRSRQNVRVLIEEWKKHNLSA